MIALPWARLKVLLALEGVLLVLTRFVIDELERCTGFSRGHFSSIMKREALPEIGCSAGIPFSVLFAS